MVNTIGQTFAWKGLATSVADHVDTCNSCQRNKHTNKKAYGKLPLVPALRNKEPWQTVHVDCGGPWKIRFECEETKKILTFDIHVIGMVDASTNWCEVARIQTASSIAVAKAVDLNWFSRYPHPLECVHDNGKEFTGIEFQELLISYGVKAKPSTVKNPQANAIVERIFGTLEEQIRTTVFDDNWSEDIDTLIQACAFALRVTTPANGPYSPAQLAFGYDLIFRQKVVIDWERKKALHQRQAIQNNAKENRKRLNYEYKVGDKVLIVFKKYERKAKITPSTYSRGPFTIVEIFDNGTVRLRCGSYIDTVSIRRITPYHSK